MKKINLSVILDSIFLTFCAFIVTFTLLFTTLSRGLSFFLATVISLNLGLITFYLLFKKSKENYLTNTEKDYANDIINQLCFNGEKTNTYLIEKAFCDLKIKYKKNQNGYLVINDEFLLYLKISFDNLSKSDLIRAYNKLSENQTALIVYANCDDEVKTFSLKFNGRIKLVNAKSVYSLLKRGNALPKVSVKLSLPKKTFIQKIKGVLTKKRAKSYFLIGFTFMLFSFFIPFKTYYITFGSLMLILSVITYFFSKPESVEKLPF